MVTHTHEAEQISYNAGWNKGRWPRDRQYRYTEKDYAVPEAFRAGKRDGALCRKSGKA